MNVKWYHFVILLVGATIVYVALTYLTVKIASYAWNSSRADILYQYNKMYEKELAECNNSYRKQ